MGHGSTVVVATALAVVATACSRNDSTPQPPATAGRDRGVRSALETLRSAFPAGNPAALVANLRRRCAASQSRSDRTGVPRARRGGSHRHAGHAGSRGRACDRSPRDRRWRHRRCSLRRPRRRPTRTGVRAPANQWGASQRDHTSPPAPSRPPCLRHPDGGAGSAACNRRPEGGLSAGVPTSAVRPPRWTTDDPPPKPPRQRDRRASPGPARRRASRRGAGT